MRMLKERAWSIISNQTVDVAVHVAQKLKKEIITINDFEQIVVADCAYNSEEGIIWSAFKPKADGVIDFATHAF